MTQPAVVYMGPDGGSSGSPKIFLRSLLFATARRGRIIQNMYVKVRRGETVQLFNIWVHGDRSLVRGSGLAVGYDGVAANHHFLPPEDGTKFQFLPGKYTLEVHASLVGSRSDILLWSSKLELSERESLAILEASQGVYFDWGPNSKRYHSHIDSRGRDRALLPGADLPGLPLGGNAPLGLGEYGQRASSKSDSDNLSKISGRWWMRDWRHDKEIEDKERTLSHNAELKIEAGRVFGSFTNKDGKYILVGDLEDRILTGRWWQISEEEQHEIWHGAFQFLLIPGHGDSTTMKGRWVGFEGEKRGIDCGLWEWTRPGREFPSDEVDDGR